MTRTFTVATYNAGDRGHPPRADIVAMQERPPSSVIARSLPGYEWRQAGKGLATAWDPTVLRHADVAVQVAHGGRARVSPARQVLTVYGLVDGVRVAVVNTHLVNNAFGPVKRGERALRLKMWWTGWRAFRAAVKRARRQGYIVIETGDLNRRWRFWTRAANRRVTGKGYDRVRVPRSVELVDAHHGDRAGSDHRPIIVTLRIKPKRIPNRIRKARP